MFLFSAIWLSHISQKQMDPDYQKNWWTLSFDDPKDNSVNFVIANHSSQKTFHWKIMINKKTIKEGDLEVETGKTRTVPVSSANIKDSKITISVTDQENNKKEIYKKL